MARLTLALLSGLTAASAFVPAASPLATRAGPRREPRAAPLEMVVNVGVIGAGRIGVVHLEALASCIDAKPIIISNPTVSKAKAAAELFNVPEWTESDAEVINHPDVDAVWICSPSQFHADQIKACAAAGKHVFCEKPIATDIAGTLEVSRLSRKQVHGVGVKKNPPPGPQAIRCCREAGVKLFSALQRRFDPNFARIKEAVRSGQVGDPIVVKLCSRDPSPPPIEYVKGGGGIFLDMAIHDLDMSRFLLCCSEPIEILASGSCHIDDSIASLPGPEAYDTASVILRYPGGREAIIDVCRQAPYGYDQRAEVLGTKAMISTDNMYPNTAKIFSKNFTGNADLPYDFFMSRYKEAYVRETEAFVQCLVDDTPSPCSGEDGLTALYMALAAGKSAEEKRWVKFTEITESPAAAECNAALRRLRARL